MRAPGRFSRPFAGLLLALVLPAATATAELVTVDTGSPTMGTPVVATVDFGDLVPPYGDMHAAYTVARQLRHAWRDGGGWHTENVPPADTALSYDIATDFSGREVVAYLRNGGRVVVADRVGSAWVADTVVTWPGITSSFPSYSLAMNPSTGEPALAMATQRNGKNRLYLARRQFRIWSVTEVDSTLYDLVAPSIAFDPQGRAHIAATGTAPGVSHGVVTVWDQVSPAAFVSAAVDTEGFTSAVIAWDAGRATPRVAYVGETVYPGPSWVRTTRYGYRGTDGVWRHVDASPTDIGGGLLIRTSLALDRFGNPGVAWIRPLAIGPNRPEETEACGGVETYHLYLSTQRSGDPGSAFDTVELPFTYPNDHLTSTRAVGALGYGRFGVVWRTPRSTSCPPYTIETDEVLSPVTDAVPGAVGPVATFALGPNPAAAGEALALRWSQPRAAGTSFALHDVAGRVIARLDAGERGPGEHQSRWAPRGLAPGCYWVTLRLGGATMARRTLVVR